MTDREPEKPRRRVQIELRLGADSWDDVEHALNNIARQIAMKQHRQGPVISGGYSSGYVFEAAEDEAVTHDSYFEANDRYLDALKGQGG